MLAIMQYTQDYDEMMPISISGKDQIGPVVVAANGVQQFSVANTIQPYIKSQQVFQCPDDNGFNGGAPTAGGFAFSPSLRVWEAYGTSYKFTKENFSVLPSTAPAQVAPYKYNRIDPSKGQLLGPPGGPWTQNPPFPLPISFFSLPSETRVMRCYVAPWETPVAAGDAKVFHDTANIMAFADGHVKTVISRQQYDSYCNGTTSSPIRVTSPGSPGDGSCNSQGLERQKD